MGATWVRQQEAGSSGVATSQRLGASQVTRSTSRGQESQLLSGNQRAVFH